MTIFPPLRHEQQINIGYCLPACAKMVLDYHNRQSSQKELARILGTAQGLGTSFTNIERLAQWRLHVEIMRWRGISAIQDALAAQKLIIAAILTTPDLPGWEQIATQHVVLVIGCADDHVIYHDPALADGPTKVSLNAFWLAWTEMEELAAVISIKE